MAIIFTKGEELNIDWSVIGAAATAVGTVVTALGVLFGAWQIRLSKKQAQAKFEDQLDQQYRSLTIDLPVDVLIGKKPQEKDQARVRELIYNYLDLTNEQTYLRAKGRISGHTWISWSSGIAAHLKRPAFESVYKEIENTSGFTYLERLVKSNYLSDPISWF